MVVDDAAALTVLWRVEVVTVVLAGFEPCDESSWAGSEEEEETEEQPCSRIAIGGTRLESLRRLLLLLSRPGRREDDAAAAAVNDRKDFVLAPLLGPTPLRFVAAVTGAASVVLETANPVLVALLHTFSLFSVVMPVRCLGAPM